MIVLREYNWRLPNNNCTALKIGATENGLSDNVFDNCSPDLKIYVPVNNDGITRDGYDAYGNPVSGAKNGVTAYKDYGLGWGDYRDKIFAIPNEDE